MESKIIYDIFNLSHWDWRIALDLFLGGIGCGAFLYVIFANYLKKEAASGIAKIGSVLAPVAVTIGLLAMLSELGHPFRIHMTFLHFNPTSILSWGGILQQAFLGLSGLFAILLFLGKFEAVRKKIGILAAASAVAVGLYHGFLLSFVTARPLWNPGVYNVISFMSLINTGIAAVLICAYFMPGAKDEIQGVSSATSKALSISLVIQLFAVIMWAVGLAVGGAAPAAALNSLNYNFGLIFWAGAVIIGLVFPLVILLPRATGRENHKPIPVPVVSAAILIGGFILRYVIVIAGQTS